MSLMKSTRSFIYLAALATFAAHAFAAEGPKAIDVKVTGKGTPVILIPGLATPGAVWDDTVKHLQPNHSCHVVTIAGFGGLPAVASEHLLDDVRDQLIAYIRQQRLDKPTLIGHSLGGTVALAIGARAPELPGKIITVDSLPFLAAIMMPGVNTADEAKQRAGGMRNMMQDQTPEQFAKLQLERTIPAMVTAPENVKRIAEMCGKSDPRIVGQAMSELLGTDLRPELAKITCPVLVLGSLADKIQFAPRPAIEGNYKTQYANAKQVQFEFFENAKHFIMIDDPAGFYATLERELAAR